MSGYRRRTDLKRQEVGQDAHLESGVRDLAEVLTEPEGGLEPGDAEV